MLRILSFDLLQCQTEVEFQQGKKQLHSLGSQRVVSVKWKKKKEEEEEEMFSGYSAVNIVAISLKYCLGGLNGPPLPLSTA